MGRKLGRKFRPWAATDDRPRRYCLRRWSSISAGAVPPPMDLLNFAPRVRVPTLMVNGRSDFGTLLETQQRPLFRLLGAAVLRVQGDVPQVRFGLEVDLGRCVGVVGGLPGVAVLDEPGVAEVV